MFSIQVIAHSLEGMRQRFSGDEQAADCERGRDGGEENKTASARFAIADSRAGDAGG